MKSGYGVNIEKESNQENNNIIYSMLDEDYISFKDINTKNILDKLPEITNSIITINSMYEYQRENCNIKIFFVYGILNDRVNNKQKEFSNIVKVDFTNKTFTILLQDYLDEKYSNISIGQDIEINIPEKIENNNYNEFGYETISDEKYVIDIFNKLKDDFIYNPKLVYNSLNDEYRKKRFGSVDNFRQYIKDNAISLISMSIDQYQRIDYEGYTQYVCINNKGDYYVFKEISVMNYEIVLDTYTIDLPEFLEKYNVATNQVKAGMNIQKVIEAINRQDYKYVYEKLDDTFKKNNYETLNKFENYINHIFYKKNTANYKKFSQEGDLLIYELEIGDYEDSNSKLKYITIIMQLKEGTDFVMSFSVQ